MGPEILIVGDRSHRGALIPRVQDLGYTVTPVRERELRGRVAAVPAPAAVLVCLGEAPAAELVSAVRRGREDVPVVLLGSLGGALRDLADVLELGADHFLAAPVSDDELARVLAELAGPGAPGEDEVEDEDEGYDDLVRPLTGSKIGDPVLGPLHRSLEALAARLQHHEPGDSETDAFDLESLGLDATPDVDGELDPPDTAALLPDTESSDPAASPRSEPTQRLVGGRSRLTDHEDSRGAMQGEDTQRLRAEATTGRAALASARVQESRLAVHDAPLRMERHAGAGPGVLDSTDRLAARREPVDRRVQGDRRVHDERREQDERREGERRRRAGPGETTARLLARRIDDPQVAGHADHADRTARVVAPRDEPGPVLRAEAAREQPGPTSPAGDTTARLIAPRQDLRAANETGPDVDLAAAGRLAGVEVVDRLWQLHATGFDGRLTVGSRDGVRRQVWWRGGQPVYAVSTAPADGLVARLQARGLLARVQLAGAARVVDEALLPSARRLVKAGLLKPREQQEAVRDVVVKICEAMCSDAAERWHTDDALAPAEVAVDASMLGLLAAGARRGLGRERLHEQLPGDITLRLVVEDPAALASALGWPGAEEWLTLLDGSRSLAQLTAEDGLDEHDLWVAACVLTAAGLAMPVEPDADAVLVAIDRRRIDERLALARASDYFALLGLGRDASRTEILRAHTDLRGTFADERLEPRTREELAGALAELRAALDEARVVLLDEALRTAYVAGLAPEPGLGTS